MIQENIHKLAIFSQNPLKKVTGNANTAESEVFLISPRRAQIHSNAIQRMESVDLSENGLTTINQRILDNIWILKLNLASNHLRSYGEEFQVLQNLRMLDLSYNYIKILPYNLNIFHPQLQEFSIKHNFISTIPKLPDSIISLNLEFNQIHIFPQNFPAQIKILLMTGNPLYQLQALPKLQKFSLEWFEYVGWGEQIQGEKLRQFSEWLMSNNQQKTVQNMIQFFIGNSFNYAQTDNQGNNLIHQAALKQHLGIILGCSNIVDKNARNKSSQTPIQIALFAQKFASVKCLLSLNANLNQQNLVTISLIKQQVHIMQAFLQHGSDPNEQDNDGNTALHYLMNKWSSIQWAEKFANLLLYYGGCPMKLNKRGLSPFHICVKKGHITAIHFALQYKGQNDVDNKCSHPFDLYQLTEDNQNVFEICMENNLAEMCEVLLQYNCQYIYCEPTSFSCIWKLISRFNLITLSEHFIPKQYSSLRQINKPINKFTCCFNLAKQLNSSHLKINYPNILNMSSSCKYYFNRLEPTKFKEGDNDYIEFSDTSIDSHEETKGVMSLNWCRIDQQKRQNAPKLFMEQTIIQTKQPYNTKIRQMAEEYYNDYLLNDNISKREEILLILLKLDMQVNIFRNLTDQSFKEILKQIFNDYFSKSENKSEQSSIQIESIFYKDSSSLSDIKSQNQNKESPQLSQKKRFFDQWVQEYLIKFVPEFSDYQKLSIMNQYELFQI